MDEAMLPGVGNDDGTQRSAAGFVRTRNARRWTVLRGRPRTGSHRCACRHDAGRRAAW